MADITGSLTIQADTLEEFVTLLNNVEVATSTSNVVSDEGLLTISYDVNTGA